MPLQAMAFSRVESGSAFPSKDVYTVRNWLKVRRTDADAHAAEVIKRKLFWDRADEQFVSEPMS